MKNLYKIEDELYIISSSEQVNFNDYYITTSNTIAKADIGGSEVANKNKRPKIILTANKLLIKDGVQTIDDDFLQWFVKNPSCESVEIDCWTIRTKDKVVYEPPLKEYEIIIPSEPKQETLEEVAENYVRNEPDATLKLISKYSFKDGAKWEKENSNVNALHFEIDALKRLVKVLEHQQERTYSEEDMKQFAWECVANFLSNNVNEVERALVEVIIDRNSKQFEQFKKK